MRTRRGPLARTVPARTVLARTVLARTVLARTVQARTVQARTVLARTVLARIVAALALATAGCSNGTGRAAAGAAILPSAAPVAPPTTASTAGQRIDPDLCRADQLAVVDKGVTIPLGGHVAEVLFVVPASPAGDPTPSDGPTPCTLTGRPVATLDGKPVAGRDAADLLLGPPGRVGRTADAVIVDTGCTAPDAGPGQLPAPVLTLAAPGGGTVTATLIQPAAVCSPAVSRWGTWTPPGPTPGPTQTPSGPGVVPYRDLPYTSADVPAPGDLLAAAGPAHGFIPPCTHLDGTADRFTVSDGGHLRTRLHLSTTAADCELETYPAVRLLAPGGTVLATAHGHPPTGPHPPERVTGGAGAMNDGSPQTATLDLDVDGLRCDPPATAQLLGAGGAVVATVPLTGPDGTCSGIVAPATLAVSAVGDASGPAPDPPSSYAALRLSLDLPAAAAHDGALAFRLRLRNPTGAPISLAACPTLLLVLEYGSRTMVGSGGPLNCAQAPGAVPAGGEIVFDERAGYGGDPPTGAVTVTAAIAGAPETKAETG